MILPCTCQHSAQDELHGRGQRVHTPTKDGKGRCTVCRAKKSLKTAEKTDKK